MRPIKKPPISEIGGLRWCGRESNPRHKDFQSFALPTELPHLFYFGNVADDLQGGKCKILLI